MVQPRARKPDVDTPLLRQRMGKWTRDQLWVMDLETGEGGLFRPGGYARGDLQKHRIWVCPMFEPFLTWLYKQDLSNESLDALPKGVALDAPFEWAGYRRPGPRRARPWVRSHVAPTRTIFRPTPR